MPFSQANSTATIERFVRRLRSRRYFGRLQSTVLYVIHQIDLHKNSKYNYRQVKCNSDDLPGNAVFHVSLHIASLLHVTRSIIFTLMLLKGFF